MKRLTLALFILIALAAPAFATAQMAETLIINGEDNIMYSEPLLPYLDSMAPRREFPAGCTALWRGYRGTWEIRDGALYLLKVQEGSCAEDAPEIPLVSLFPAHKGGPVKAVWYTGTLRVPQGRALSYAHMGYESVFERDLFIEVEHGIVKSVTAIDNSGRKEPMPPSLLP